MTATLGAGVSQITRSKIVGPGIATLATIIIGIIVSFAGNVFISRQLGVSGYGCYSILVSWAMLATLPASIGLDSSIMRFMPIYLLEGSTRRYRRLIIITAAAQFVGVAMVAGLMVLGDLLGVGTLSWARTGTLGWVALMVGATVAGNTAGAVLQSAQRVIVAQVFLNAVRPSLVLLLVASLIYVRPAEYDAIDLFRVTVGATIMALIPLAIYIARRFFAQPAVGTYLFSLRKWLMFGFTNLAAGIGLQALIQLPILIVGTSVGTEQAGYYGVASRLASTVLLGLAALASVSMPLISTAFASSDVEEVRRIARTNVRLSSILALILTILIILMGQWMLSIFGANFVEAYLTLVVLMTGLTISSTFGVAIAVVTMSGHPSVVALANMIGVVILVALARLLVPSIGSIGGAIAYSIANILAIGIIATFAYKFLGINTTIISR